MGKPTVKKSKQGDGGGSKSGDGALKHPKQVPSSKAFDEDTAIFITMSQEFKEDGKKLFQKRDHEGAMLKYEKALKLLPKNHIDVAYLRSNMAECYMQMGIGEYPRAINECNLALEVAPKYSRALLKRARCYEALNKLDMALRDVNSVLVIEPKNLTALEIGERLREEAEKLGVEVDEKHIDLSFEYKKRSPAKLFKTKSSKEKSRKKKNVRIANDVVEAQKVENKEVEAKQVENKEAEETRVEDKLVEDMKVESQEVDDKTSEHRGVEDKQVEDKLVVSEENKVKEIKDVTRTVKLVFGEDIRWAQLPINSSIWLVKDIVRDRFPSLKGVLLKYRDQEGDLVTITTTEELRFAETIGDSQNSLRLYVVEVSEDQEPNYDGRKDVEELLSKGVMKTSSAVENENVYRGGELGKGPGVDEWVIQFARLFKNYVGLDSDSYLDLHEVGMKLYSEAMEETVSCEDAQKLFEIAADKFQEMAALALFNWGNVHMSRSRKHVVLSEDGSREAMLAQIKTAYEWAQKEYTKAGMRYEESIKIKPDFYEGYLALGHQQFEQAKTSWYYGVANNVHLEPRPSVEVIHLYNKAEDSMERGMLMWEELEERRLNGLSKFDEYKVQLEKMGLGGLVNDISSDDAAEQAENMKSQIYILWGTVLYERSIVEFKLGIPAWEECLEVAVEKFELAGISPTEIAVIVKNHCSNGTALEGFGFKIDEVVQAWNEMYVAKRWQIGVPSFRLEPLFRRRAPKLQEILEHI